MTTPHTPVSEPHVPPQSEGDVCPICLEPFKVGEECAEDITEGTCHAECLEGSPVVDRETEEPSDGPVLTWKYEAPSVPLSEGAGEREALAQIIEKSLLGVEPDDQDMVLEDHDWRLILTALRSSSTPSTRAEPFQPRVHQWLLDCFGWDIAGDRQERGDRLLEEVLELLQSGGYDPARVSALRDYVWGRPVGEPAQEVGGVMVTLAAYCVAHDLDMMAAGETELVRIVQPKVVEKIRAKQAAKPTGSALPIAQSTRAEAEPVACALPPAGWVCSRGAGHEGPCAASPVDVAKAAIVRALRRWLEWDFEGASKEFDAGATHVLNALHDDRAALPAADADKLRIAKEALEPFAEIAGRYLTGGLREDLEHRSPCLIKRLEAKDFYRARKALAALNEGAKS